jgi:hypothetical protein
VEIAATVQMAFVSPISSRRAIRSKAEVVLHGAPSSVSTWEYWECLNQGRVTYCELFLR